GCRRVDRRSAPRSRERALRRRAVADVRRVRRHDATPRLAGRDVWALTRDPGFRPAPGVRRQRLAFRPAGLRMMEMRVATHPHVAYQGEPGAYSEMGITREWGGAATAVAAPTFVEAIGMLGRGRVNYAVIPVWNST